MTEFPQKLISLSLCPLPVDPKTKRPFFEWKFLQFRFPTNEELNKWRWPGVAIICGKISSNLEVIDFDEKYKKGIFEEWTALLPPQSPLDRCAISQTQHGGFHVIYRCSQIEGNAKLARSKNKNDIWIETRGEGGYVLEYPNEGYKFIQGDFDSIPVITPEERQIFLETARALTEEEPPVAYEPSASVYSGETRPGDDFNARASWKDILEPHGWALVGQKGEKRFWRRPEKKIGISATENWNGYGMLFVFSTSTVFETEKGYTKFHAYTLLNHEGDFRKAAHALADEGYGASEKKSYDSEFFLVTNKNEDEDEKEGLVVQRASEITPKNINWLWEGKIPKGKLCLIAGNPGLGKSQAALSFASVVSRGLIFPTSDQPVKKSSVLILSAEDDASDTMVPRLIAAEADLTKIYFVNSVKVKTKEGMKERGFSLIDDLILLTKKIDEIKDVALIIVDPMDAYMGFSDKKDTYRNSDVRAFIMPIVKIMASRSVAFVGITHFNKNVSADAIARVIGSIGFIAAARTAYAVIKDSDNEGRRLFLPVKNNLALDTKGAAYFVKKWGILEKEKQIETAKVEWEDEELMDDTNEALRKEGRKQKENGNKIIEAQTWLVQKLTQNPEGLLRSAIISMAEEKGISERTIERVKTGIDIISEKTGVKNERLWKMADIPWNIEK